MKKVLSILLLLVYTFTAAGAVMEWHYCMGRLESVELGVNDDHTCKRCGMEIGFSNCCKDEVIVAKISDSHSSSQFDGRIAPISIELPEWFQPTRSAHFLQTELTNVGIHLPPPPLLGRQSLLCVFRC